MGKEKIHTDLGKLSSIRNFKKSKFRVSFYSSILRFKMSNYI